MAASLLSSIACSAKVAEGAGGGVVLVLEKRLPLGFSEGFQFFPACLVPISTLSLTFSVGGFSRVVDGITDDGPFGFHSVIFRRFFQGLVEVTEEELGLFSVSSTAGVDPQFAFGLER